MRYGRGRGIHSPKAYSMVQMLLRPHASYYHFEEYSFLFSNPLYQLLYRAIARLQPQVVILLDQDCRLERIVRLASTTVMIADQMPLDLNNTLVISKNVVDLELTESTYLILTDIRRTKRAEKVFYEWVDKIPSGIILDFYDASLIVGMNKVKYVYRTTL
ncbi:hypothetical protein [Porphyromonas sp.]|uniref:hypothetical protein n=1 Tax=Porphyromonas sp. TaxID=1924944 RepID=UPI002A7549E2|nr:hypothetical protein [Porphyromonas sp.]